jgi:hypothetical protein
MVSSGCTAERSSGSGSISVWRRITLLWRLLERRDALNGLPGRVIQAAAAAEDGTLKLDIGGEFWENTLLKAGNAERKVSVLAVPLARLVEEMPESLTVLICDIEGAEQ